VVELDKDDSIFDIDKERLFSMLLTIKLIVFDLN
jgi:hypothetical protein